VTSDAEQARRRPAIWQLADEIQMDLRAAAGKLTALRAELAALGIEDTPRLACPDCTLTFRGPNELAEHRYASHDGPVPEAWERAERLAG
jgi:hypothetical protein